MVFYLAFEILMGGKLTVSHRSLLKSFPESVLGSSIRLFLPTLSAAYCCVLSFPTGLKMVVQCFLWYIETIQGRLMNNDSADRGLGARSGWAVFVNKVLLEHSVLLHLCIICGHFGASTAESSSCDRDSMTCKA